MGREIVTSQQNRLGQATLPDEYKDKLIKLIPTEIVTAYVTIVGLISGTTTGNKTDLLWFVIAVLTIVTPLYLKFVSKVKLLSQIIFTMVAFLLWVLATGSPIPTIFDFQSTFIGSILLILYTLFIPFVFPNDPPSP
ncbi:MAG: hypothetical protein HOP10_03055 [Chitinophagaceae bacterium]|nr:hypothetical protein [Chitinophagaceae bacterium]